MATTEALPPTLSVEQAAKVMGVSRRHAYYLAKREEIPVVRFGGRIRIPTRRLVAMIDGAS